MPGREPKVRPIGILLVGLPRMVRDLIEPIVAREKDMEIVGEGTMDESLRTAATGPSGDRRRAGSRDPERCTRPALRAFAPAGDRTVGRPMARDGSRSSTAIDGCVVDRENLVPVIQGTAEDGGVTTALGARRRAAGIRGAFTEAAPR